MEVKHHLASLKFANALVIFAKYAWALTPLISCSPVLASQGTLYLAKELNVLMPSSQQVQMDLLLQSFVVQTQESIVRT